MTGNEIKKALECCWIKGLCNGCPLDKDAGGTPCKQLGNNALDLINRQQAEIEMLKEPTSLIINCEVTEDMLKTLKNQKVITISNDEVESICLWDEHVRFEAIKEFAEQSEKALFIKQDEHRKHWEEYLTQYRTTTAYSEHEQAIDNWLRGYGEAVQDILSVNDNLVKEMVGDAE